jgi:hypothetical protein
MLIWNIYDNMSLAACLYRILQEKDKGVQDEWYTFMMYNVFNGLYWGDGSQEESISKKGRFSDNR